MRFTIKIVLILSLYGFSAKLSASHLIGGNIRYDFIEYTNNEEDAVYKITLTGYYDCNSQYWGSTFPENELLLKAYEGTFNDTLLYYRKNISLSRTVNERINPDLPANCSFSLQNCVQLVEFSAEVELPVTRYGYHIVYDRCCRPPGITNLHSSHTQAMTFHAFIGKNRPSSGGQINSSSVFSDTLVSYVCKGDSNFINHSSQDPDGDRLEYSIVHPYRGITLSQNSPVIPPGNTDPYEFPPRLVTWMNGYSMSDPLGAGGYAGIGQNSGLSFVRPPQTGFYALDVEIKEFRNGELVGVSRRAMQIMAVDCPHNSAPVLNSLDGHPQNAGDNKFVVEEGDSICFDVGFLILRVIMLLLR